MPQKLATYCCDLLFTASIPGFSRTAFSKSSDEFKGFMRNGISDIVRIFDKNYLFLSNILKGYWIILNNSMVCLQSHLQWAGSQLLAHSPAVSNVTGERKKGN